MDHKTHSAIIEFQLRKYLGFNSLDFLTMTPTEIMRQYECLKIQNEIDERRRKEAQR